MKKIFLSLVLYSLVCFSVFAENMPDIKYKNIGINSKISYDELTHTWSNKADKKSQNYYTKTKGFGDFYDYIDSSKNFAFTTECEYEFLYKDTLIGYSNSDMKFYEIKLQGNEVNKRVLSKEELINIFPEYKIINLTDFSASTNSIKIKKHLGDLKVLLINDTDKEMNDYTFSSGNAKFKKYKLKGFLKVTKPGMIQFAKTSEIFDPSNWYIILVR